MATIELLDELPPARADHWHRVRAPGGYEWWEFDAWDERQGIRAVLSFHDGFAFDPEYARRYDAYRRRPTVNAPPVPREFPCAQLAIIENDVVLARETVRLGDGAFQVEGETGSLNMGANRVALGNGETRVRFQGGDPTISGELLFGQTFFSSLPVESVVHSFETMTEHRWVVAQPRCDVDGRICFNGREIPFLGLGYHDHYYGAGPIGPDVRRWLRGRAISRGRTVAFGVSTEDSSGRDEFVAIDVDDAGMRPIGLDRCSCDWKPRSWRGLAIPAAVNFGERLVLRRARVVDSTAVSAQVLFDAFIDGEACSAWGEIVYPGRLHKGLVHCGVMKWLEG